MAASNAADPTAVTYIHRDPLENIPLEIRDGADATLGRAMNARNRESKRLRFGFSTSEDAVTWVIFTYLLRSGRLAGALERAGLTGDRGSRTDPALLLWGVPVDGPGRGDEIRDRLHEICARLGEDPGSLSEPDVLVDLGDDGIVVIEVKYLSGNDSKPADYPGWIRYSPLAQMGCRLEAVKVSGCYELARNWCLSRILAGDRPNVLANLGPGSLFRGPEGERLDGFVSALGTDDRARFVKLTWADFLGPALAGSPPWFSEFCSARGLISSA